MNIDGLDTSKEAWDELEKIFGTQAKSSKISLLIQFFELKLEKGESLVAHLNIMKSLTTQLARIKVFMDEDVCIAILLKSLPQEDYGPIVTTLTNLPSPKLVDIVGSLMEEEKKLNRQGLIYVEAYFTKNTSKGSTSKNFSKDKFKCNLCGKP